MGFFKAVIFIFFIIGSASTTRTYGQSIPEVIVPFELSNDHIIIQLRIENSQPLNFMFDSGAGGTLIVKDVADSLGLEPSVYRKNIGVSGAHQVGVIKNAEIHLEGESFRTNLLSTETYFEELDDGRKVHGIIGYPILSRYVVEINYSTNQLKLYDRSDYRPNQKAKAIPIVLLYNLPIAKASIVMYNGEEFEGDFLVDTGARSDMLISSLTVLAFDMQDNIGKNYTVRSVIGSSQRKSKIRYGRLKSVEFGGYMFNNLPVALSSDNKGVLAMGELDGIIGNRLLQRFNVTFDYQRSTIYLEPGVLMGNDYVINSSGFNIYFKGGRPFIKDIVDRSPADKSGLHEGDELIAVNNELVENMPVDKIRNSFTRKKGKITIVIKRNNKLKYTELELEPLI